MSTTHGRQRPYRVHRRLRLGVRFASGLLIELVIAAQLILAAISIDRASTAEGPGSIISVQPMQGAPDGASAFRIIYASTAGLGTPEIHPYLVGVSEGRAVLDSVRAARQIPNVGAGVSFAVWGHSQGGQATLYAGLLARQYAPELRLVGVAAAAPATDLATLMKDDRGTGGGNNITAMTLWSWSRIYGAPIAPVVKPEAVPVID
jgi:pimeloyl-ACP methyl ester carboxylesterase